MDGDQCVKLNKDLHADIDWDYYKAEIMCTVWGWVKLLRNGNG